MNDITVRVYGKQDCPDTRAARGVLDAAGQDYEWIDVEADPAKLDEAAGLNGGSRKVPTLVVTRTTILVEPSDDAVGAALA